MTTPYSFVGLLFGAIGVVAGITADLGPGWYPIALAAEALPCAWLGGTLYLHRNAVR